MKILVNAPSGEQQVIELGDGGGYFDPSRVLWDEREDGPMPEITLGGMVREGGALAFDAARAAASDAGVIQQAIAAFVRRVDADVDAIYAAAVGNRGPEYDQAAIDAAAYKAAGYVGAVPASVASWAAAKGWSAQAATDDILVAAARLAQARDTIRAQRLLRKEQARVAVDSAALGVIESTWTGFVGAVRAQLGV